MKTNIDKCDINMTIYDFAIKNTTTGNLSLGLYGDKAANWINGNERVPYIVIDGKMKWNIRLKNVTIFNLIKTFKLNIDNDLEIEYDEIQNWGRFMENAKLQKKIFKIFLKNNIKRWEPKEKKLNINRLMKFIDSTEVKLDFVFDAIWIRNAYSLEEFEFLFSVSKKEADNILRSAGYVKKKCDAYYYLEFQRKRSILECMEKTCKVVSLKENDLMFLSRLKRTQYSMIEKIGEKVAEYGRCKNYNKINNLSWSEPVYNKREDKLDIFLASFLVVGMLVFVVVIVVVFSYQINMNGQGKLDSIYSFWGSIAGSMIAGVVTIITTYFIIRRSYKIDFHQERIAVLPFFEIKILKYFSKKSHKIPKDVKDIIGEKICYEIDSSKKAMLLEIKNVGNGSAFQVGVEGLTMDYEEPIFQSITQKCSRFVICDSKKDLNIIVKYSDIYNNYYYQRFCSEINDRNANYIGINADLPEIVLRTKKTRYIQ